MASPFRFFHKYQKLFIILAAVTAMFVFVLADPLSQWLQSPSDNVRTATSPVASWDGGSLNQQQLKSLVARRRFMSRFLQIMVSEGVQRTIKEGGTPVDPKVPNFILPENVSRQGVEEEVIKTRIMAELARQSGMTVSDAIVNNYLLEFGLHRVDGDDILGLLGRMQGGKTALNERMLFDALREQLLRHQFFSTYGSALQSILPQERWEDWSRLNERIALQTAVLPIEQFISEVPEPTDDQLAAFYEEHKEREPGLQYRMLGTILPAPDPGFREPRRVRLHYLLGDVNAWREKFLETVTDDEIADYYERNKRSRFVKTSFSEIEDEPENETGDKTEAEDEAETALETEDKAESSAEDESQEEKTSESDGEAPAVEEAEVEAEAAEPATDKTGAVAKPSPFRLTALEDQPSEEDSPSEATESKEAEETIEEDLGGEEKLEGKPEKESEEKEKLEEEEPKEYTPLENVKDVIRHQLANEKAVQALEPVMGQTYTELRTAFNKYAGLLIDAKSRDQEIPKPPAKLAQLDSLAEKLGLVFEKTGLLSPRELNESTLGRASDIQTGRMSVTATAFSDSNMLYEPSLNKDPDGNWYLCLRVEDEPTRVPELKEIRSKVLAAWKRNEAAQLALAQAETLAKEASEASEPFEKFFADKGFEVKKTDLFSWLTFGTARGGIRLGEVPSLSAIGPEFMAAAFALQAEEVKGVLNFDHTKAYIIRVHLREETEEDLHKLFLSEINNWKFGNYMRNVRMQTNRRRLEKQLFQRVGLEFDPDWEKSTRRNSRR